MAQLDFTPNLQRRIRAPQVRLPASDVSELLRQYFERYPHVRGYLLDDQGALRKHLVILVDGSHLRDRAAQSDLLRPDSEVFVFQALSGG